MNFLTEDKARELLESSIELEKRVISTQQILDGGEIPYLKSVEQLVMN